MDQTDSSTRQADPVASENRLVLHATAGVHARGGSAAPVLGSQIADGNISAEIGNSHARLHPVERRQREWRRWAQPQVVGSVEKNGTRRAWSCAPTHAYA